MSQTALNISNLKKSYANGFQALKGVSLKVNKGDFFSLLGPNGAGKTTMIGILATLVNKTEGTIEVFDQDFDKNREVIKANMGFVPQEINLNPFEHAFQILVNQAGFYGIPRKIAKARAEKFLKTASLWEKRNTPTRHLSGGMKRRLMIARAMMNEPKLLFLDEPTAGVDVEIRQAMWETLAALNKQGTTIILTTHYLEEAESLCNRVAIIDQGEIIEESSMRALLDKLESEILVMYLENKLEKAPTLSGFKCELIDPQTLEIEIKRGQNLNEVFNKLSEHNIAITGMRNKSNRLEKLFIEKIQQKDVA